MSPVCNQGGSCEEEEKLEAYSPEDKTETEDVRQTALETVPLVQCCTIMNAC